MDEHVWRDAVRDGNLTEEVSVRVELFIARRIVRWYRHRGQHAEATAWALRHYGREAGHALLRLR